MFSTHSGKALQDGNANAAKTAKAQRPASKKTGAGPQEPSVSQNKKRKAQEPPPAEEDKENVQLTATPPPAESKAKDEPGQREKTPGRVGPVRRTSFSATPDIKPFKGPPGKKVRKTRYEKNEEYKQFIRENENHCFHDLYVCFDKGPNGSPTYDKAGFELDYEKVANWMKPKAYNKSAMINGMNRSLEKAEREKKRMAEIFFEKGEAPEKPECQAVNHWKDRVSKDLNVPWHRIGVEHFEEWEKRGFKKARKGEYEEFSEKERERMSKMLEGASLRK